MGIHDRPYMTEGDSGGIARGRPGGGLMAGMPKAGKAVKVLLIINVVVFVLQMILDQPRGDGFGVLSAWLGATPEGFWQVWRYVTFQFLHSTDGIWHIAMNMLGLYMLGTPLEQKWGSRRFVRFYLICGAVGGLAYVVIGRIVGGQMMAVPIIGASGGVFGILLACAVLFPNFKLIFFLFPVPIRMAALIIFGGMILVILGSVSKDHYSPQFWSDVAHLGGAAAAAFWIWGLPKLTRATTDVRTKRQEGAWQRKLERQAAERVEIDRILDKVHTDGLNSLSAREKRTLQDATKRQREEGR